MGNELLQELPEDLKRIIGESKIIENTLGCSNSVVLHLDEIAAYRSAYLKIAPYSVLGSHVCDRGGSGPEADQINGWFVALAEFEALSSLSGLGFDNPQYTLPECCSVDQGIMAVALGHPAIPSGKRICNDLCIRRPGSVLVITDRIEYVWEEHIVADARC